MFHGAPHKTLVLAAGVLLALVAQSGLLLGQEPDAFPRTVDFWPKRLNPDSTPLLHVQLAAAEKHPVARLECGARVYELGPATWSHNLGYVHAFDLEFSAARTRANCIVRVTGRKGQEYVGSRPLALRTKVAKLRVGAIRPDVAAVGDESPVELVGAGFGGIVNVIWVATDRNESYSRTVRAADVGGMSGAVAPFLPGKSAAGAGEYLVVVENDDHAAAVYHDHFVVEEMADPEVVRSTIEQRGGKDWVSIEGFGLGALENVHIELASGTLPLQFETVEGMALETLRVELPPQTEATVALMPELLFADRQLTIRLVKSSRLTQSTGELPPSRD